MKLRSNSEHGAAHLVLVVVVAVAVIFGVAGFMIYKNPQKVASNDKYKADAAGAYSSLCGAGYDLRHAQNGAGFTLYNYRNASGNGCAIVVNNNWGASSTMQVTARRTNGSVIQNDGPRTYRYYAGPIYYYHSSGTRLQGMKNGSWTGWTIQ